MPTIVLSKEELQALTPDALIVKAAELGIKDLDKIESRESLEDMILEAQTPGPRKRTRISKKEVDHVYMADTEGEGESFDNAKKAKEALKNQGGLFKEEPTAPKKKRGRPSKSDIAAKEAYEAELQSIKSEAEATEEIVVEQPTETHAEPMQQTLDFAEDSIPEVSENIEEDVVKEETPNEENTSSLSPELTKAIESGFVILHDVPELGNQAEDCDTTEEETRGGFRRFKDDPDVTTDPRNGRPMTRVAQPDLNLHVVGVLEIEKDGTGYVRSADYNYLPSPDDVYVANSTIRQYSLRQGDMIDGFARLPRKNEKHFVLVSIDHINGIQPIEVRDRQVFEHLTPLFPNEKFNICAGNGSDTTSCRVVDLFSPIGKGQRALIVAQPKTGKTMLMKEVANAIARQHPDAYLMILLIDERPEEVTDMARTVNAEVIASTFDEPAAHHVRIANIVLEKAKRMVECGHDVVIFLDSITRLARAYNTVAPGSGKVLTGGVDANALQKPKRFFGAARNIEDGGSLTIIATALIDTGSKMDEVIFEEFKGTGNMELQLDRQLANKRIFPAVNLTASSTRRDELLLDELAQQRMWAVRNHLADMNSVEAMSFIKKRIDGTINNEEFLLSVNG